MIRSKRIAAIMRLSRVETDAAARTLASSTQGLAAYEDELQQLRVYRIEHANQLRVRGGRTLGGAEIRNHLIFIQKLDEAVARLEVRVATQRRANARDQERWLGARHKTKALDGIALRHRGSEERARQHREQLASDDRSQR